MERLGAEEEEGARDVSFGRQGCFRETSLRKLGPGETMLSKIATVAHHLPCSSHVQRNMHQEMDPNLVNCLPGTHCHGAPPFP